MSIIKIPFLPVALQNWATGCCYSSYSGHVVAPALSTCLNADSSPVEPEQTEVGWKYNINDFDNHRQLPKVVPNVLCEQIGYL